MVRNPTGNTLVEDVLGEEIQYNGTVWTITRLNPEEHQNETRQDVEGYGYRLVCEGEDAPPGAEVQIMSNNLIGCPKCKENRYADFTGEGEYECVCGYSNELNIATLLSP